MFASLFAASIITLIIICLICAPLFILYIVASWKLYKKCGKEGWEGIVPIYRLWVLVDITGTVWWAFLILLFGSLIPAVGTIIVLFTSFCINYNLAIKMGKDPIGYGIGLTFLPIIFFPILAFGNATFTDKKVSKYGVIPEDKVNSAASSVKETAKKTSTSKGTKFCTNCGAELTGGKFCSKCGHEIH